MTVALSAEQFNWLKQAIANQRDIEETLSQMHRQTLDYMCETETGRFLVGNGSVLKRVGS